MRKVLFTFFTAAFCWVSAFSQQPNPHLNSGELIQKGLELHDKQDYKEAVKMFGKVSRSDTNYVLSLYEAAVSLQADSNFTQALVLLEKALSLPTEREQESDLLLLHGSLLDDIGKYDEAISVYDSLLRKYPAVISGYLNKGFTLMRLEKYAEAENLYQKAILINPYNAAIHYRLGTASYLQGKMLPAFLAFTGYLMVNPEGDLGKNAISIINSIASKPDEMRAQTVSLAEGSSSPEIEELEAILFSKIALDAKFKPSIKLDDVISRQMEVLFDQAKYNPSSQDFYVQFYFPIYREVLKGGYFEPFVNHLFSNVSIKAIEDYNKKHKKEIQKTIDLLVEYLREIRSTRQLDYSRRKQTSVRYTFSEGSLTGKGMSNSSNLETGKWEFYFGQGNIRSVGSFNDKGDRSGEWNYYHFTGKKRAVENYVNDKVDGRCLYYYENGNLSEDNSYSSDQLHGLSAVYYYTGGTKTKTQYSHGKLNGEKRYYYPSGMLQIIENYRNDSLHGTYQSFHENGKPDFFCNYENGTSVGQFRSYAETGALVYEGNYIAGKIEGLLTRYHLNGKVKAKEQYIHGLMEGVYEEFHNNGQLGGKLVYRKGKINGEATYYDTDGKLHFILVYDSDKLQKARYFDKAGNQIRESVFRSGQMELTNYYPDGVKRRTAILKTNSELEKNETIYYRNGEIREVNEYSNGSMNGFSTAYHMNKIKRIQTSYVDGTKTGAYNSWYQNERAETIGWYLQGDRAGNWLEYDDHGNLMSDAYYIDDLKHGSRNYYWPDGKKSKEQTYHYGWLINTKQFDTSGNLIHENRLQSGTGTFKNLNILGNTTLLSQYLNGNFHGAYTEFYFDGKPESKQFYKHGMLDSIFQAWYHNGKPSVAGKFRMGEREGTWNFYNENGTLNQVEFYKNGKMEGINITYHENGKPHWETTYSGGVRTGTNNRYDDEGNLVFQLIFEDDEPVAYSYHDLNGKLRTPIPLPGNTGTVETYYANGKAAAKFNYVEGVLHGDYSLLYSNGNKWHQRSEEYNLIQGPMKEYYKSGKIKSEINYVNDNRHGTFNEYYENGKIRESGNFHSGSYHGSLLSFTSEGKLSATHTYYFGHLLSVENAR